MMAPHRFGWWLVAERLAQGLTTPSDVARSDTRVEDILAGSRLFAAGRWLEGRFRSAWPESRASRVWRLVTRDLVHESAAGRVRLGGLITTIGAVTALVLQTLEPMRTSRFDAIVPAVAAVAGVLVWLGAGPLARALANRRP